MLKSIRIYYRQTQGQSPTICNFQLIPIRFPEFLLCASLLTTIHYSLSTNFSAANKVFFISITFVTGPTPPGTGVMADTFSITSS